MKSYYSSPPTAAASVDILEAMIRTEENAYYPPPPATMNDASHDDDPISLTSDRFTRAGIESRNRMLDFYYELLSKIDSDDKSHSNDVMYDKNSKAASRRRGRQKNKNETAEIAITYLDRFLAHPAYGSQVLRDSKFFSLASTTCLYIAIKIHEIQAITPLLLADLSHGIFTAKDVEDMEIVLLNALQWKMNPPTLSSFLRQYINVIFTDGDSTSLLGGKNTISMKQSIYDMARCQTEFALKDSRLFFEKKSWIVYAAVTNALERLYYHPQYSDAAEVALDILNDKAGNIVMENPAFYSMGYLQSILHMELNSEYGFNHTMVPSASANKNATMRVTPSPTLAPSPVGSKNLSCFLSSPTNSTTISSLYHHVSPRSVNNNTVA